ncbi:signal peptidase I SipW [Fredinandcohnia onubensis]|uniref:signal peptidase I SipW n=1 Tax=Fredinandcohnia onubensis TaxID=1571209 RepID=UPI000C0BE915|nr:signal peptidase I [Fredinandcohnia onubensis]
MTKKILKITSNAISVILFLLLLVMVFVVISSKASGGEPQIFGYQLKTVLSGSMEPTFKTGSIISVKPVEDKTGLEKNDVITFIQEDKSLVTHRVMEVIENNGYTTYRTKGDNNEDMDIQPVLAENVVAEYTGFTIPYVGYLINFAQSGKGTAILLIIPGILLLGYSGLSIYQAIKEIEKNSKPQDNGRPA